jgi:Transposase DDE domain
MTTLSVTHDEDWEALVAHLPPEYERLAHEHKQLELQYGNAKITTAKSLLRFIFLHVGADLPLRQTVALMAEAGGPSLSPMRLHKKMRRATPYLHALVERMVSWTADAQPERWAGYSVTLVDATAICKPGTKGTDARIHTKLRAADVAILDAVVTDVSRGETLKHFEFAPNELVIGDRVYCNGNNVARVLEYGADLLVRYNRGSLPLSHRGASLDVLARLRKLKGQERLDIPVSFEHDEGPISGRLIACRLPKNQAEKARKRLRDEQGPSHVTEESLEAAAYVILFTTVPRDRMDAAQCLHAYRLRWQIELQFKRWKSLCGFDRLPNYLDDTIVAWLHAKVLLGLLLDRMGSIRDELSPPVRLATIQRPPRRPRRRRTSAADGSTAVEADEHSLPASARGDSAPLAAQRTPQARRASRSARTAPR